MNHESYILIWINKAYKGISCSWTTPLGQEPCALSAELCAFFCPAIFASDRYFSCKLSDFPEDPTFRVRLRLCFDRCIGFSESNVFYDLSRQFL